MAFKVFAILVLLAVGANAQGNLNDAIGNSIQAKVTELDCLVNFSPTC